MWRHWFRVRQDNLMTEGDKMKCKKNNCNANALKNADGYCYQHSKTVHVERHKARSEGGRHTKRRIRHIKTIDTIQNVKDILSETLLELRSCSGDVLARSRGIGYLCSIMLDCIEKSDFEQRLSDLEKRITN
jgi:hypothetical protein